MLKGLAQKFFQILSFKLGTSTKTTDKVGKGVKTMRLQNEPQTKWNTKLDQKGQEKQQVEYGVNYQTIY